MNEKKYKVLKNIKCFFLDLDGTFYLGNQILPGSLEFLEEIEKRNLKVLFVTNNSSRSANYYVEKLKKMGVREPFLNVLTSGQATAGFALQKFPKQKAYLLANEIVTVEMLEAGIKIDYENPDYVMITYDTELTYEKLDRVCLHLRSDLPYIASHPDLNCPMEYGFAPDIGATIAYIEASTGRRPDYIIGKPNSYIIDQGISLVKEAKENIAMVGDRLYTDLQAAINSGILGVLVMSGETNHKLLAESTVKPDLIFDRLLDLVEFLD